MRVDPSQVDLSFLKGCCLQVTKLSKTELGCLYFYTTPFHETIQDFSRKKLRGKLANELYHPGDAWLAGAADLRLYGVFSKLPELPRSLRLYRGVSRPPSTGNEAAFVSTSLEKRVARRFTSHKTRCCLLIVNVPEGSPVLPLFMLSRYSELEFLLRSKDAHFV